MPQIDADAVLALAHAQGQAWIDPAAAGRIAAGAAAAVAAVHATLRSADPGLLTVDSATFLDVLEALADPQR